MKVIAFLLALLLFKASAGTVCNGTLTGRVIQGDVSVMPTYNCELIDTIVYGNVIVNGEGDSLVTSGNTMITGNVYSTKALTVELMGQTHINGSVVAANMGDQLVIGANASVGAVQAIRTDLLLSGTARSVESYGDGMAATITGSVSQGVVVRDFMGDVSLCGAKINQALTLTNVEGEVAVGGPDCVGTEIGLGITLVGGKGKVGVYNTSGAGGKLIANNHDGDVVVKNSVIRELIVDHLNGKFNIESVTKLSIGVVKDVDGDVTMRKVRVLGRDFTVTAKRISGKLLIEESQMALQDLVVEEVSSVIVRGSRLRNAVFTRNKDVTFVNNEARTATFSFNEGTIEVRENQKLRVLTCFENSKIEGASAVPNNTCFQA